MKFNLFQKKLPDTIERDRILEELRTAEGHLLETTLPAYESIEQLMKTWSPQSKVVIGVNATITQHLESRARSTNLITQIHSGLDQNVRENIHFLENYVAKHFNERVLADGITFAIANVLQLVEMISFTIHYARRYLDFALTLESIELDKDSLSTSGSITPGEIEWIQQNAVNFAIAFNCATRARANVDKALEAIPEIAIVEGNEDTLSRTLGISKIDPFNLRLVPLAIHPFYLLGMWWVEIEAERRKAAIEELKRIQARKLHLENLKEGKSDPRIEKEIIGITNRIQLLNNRIRKIQEKAER